MKSIYITRNITLQRAGKEDVVLAKGHHAVDDDVAAHPFVKHHTASVSDAGADAGTELIAAKSEIERLQGLLNVETVHAARDRDEAADLRTTLNAAHSDLRGALQRADTAEQSLAAAQAAIAERDAALAAHAAMQAPTATEAKAKAK